jgi:hypothetical protein
MNEADFFRKQIRNKQTDAEWEAWQLSVVQ